MKSSVVSKKGIAARKRKDKIYQGLFLLATMFGVVVLAILILDILRKGGSAIDFNFLSNFLLVSQKRLELKRHSLGRYG